jgi:hypothetical protein
LQRYGTVPLGGGASPSRGGGKFEGAQAPLQGMMRAPSRGPQRPLDGPRLFFSEHPGPQEAADVLLRRRSGGLPMYYPQQNGL